MDPKKASMPEEHPDSPRLQSPRSTEFMTTPERPNRTSKAPTPIERHEYHETPQASGSTSIPSRNIPTLVVSSEPSTLLDAVMTSHYKTESFENPRFPEAANNPPKNAENGPSNTQEPPNEAETLNTLALCTLYGDYTRQYNKLQSLRASLLNEQASSLSVLSTDGLESNTRSLEQDAARMTESYHSSKPGDAQARVQSKKDEIPKGCEVSSPDASNRGMIEVLAIHSYNQADQSDPNDDPDRGDANEDIGTPGSHNHDDKGGKNVNDDGTPRRKPIGGCLAEEGEGGESHKEQKVSAGEDEAEAENNQKVKMEEDDSLNKRFFKIGVEESKGKSPENQKSITKASALKFEPASNSPYLNTDNLGSSRSGSIPVSRHASFLQDRPGSSSHDGHPPVPTRKKKKTIWEIRAEIERIEAERAEAERVEAERIEALRFEKERILAEKLEKERVDAERAKVEEAEARNGRNSLRDLFTEKAEGTSKAGRGRGGGHRD